jgi:kynurenine formamidase
MTTNNWGRWGADDERGALNHLTPEVIQAAATSITTGRVYSLGIPIQGQGVPLLDYRGTPMRLTLQDGSDDGMFAVYGAQEGTGAHEDVLVMASHTTSHMDALVHVYEDHKHYNGVPFSEMRALSGAAKLGIEKVDGFAARAVILDMVKHLGAENWLEPGTMVTAADLQGAAEAQGTEVRAGDVVLVRTGHLQMWWANNAAGVPEGFAQAGIGADAANWLASMDVTAVGADNAAVEVIPFDENDFLIVHKILLVQAGIYMLEHLDLAAAAANGDLEGLIAVAPLKVTGATGSPVNPIFIA